MPLRDDLQPVSRDETADLFAVWEASVRATHTFLAEEDIAFFRPLVADVPAVVAGTDARAPLSPCRRRSRSLDGPLNRQPDRSRARRQASAGPAREYR